MTKKDYIKFADLLKQLKRNKNIYNWSKFDYEYELLNGVLNIFKNDNKDFNIPKFITYINKPNQLEVE